MALDSTRLKDALKPEIEAQIRAFLSLGATPYPQLTAFSEAMATAIATKVVNEIKTNGQTQATFSGTYPVAGGSGGTVTITNQAVNGTVT